MRSLLIISGMLFLFTSSAQKWTWTEDQLYWPRIGLSAAMLDDTVIFSGGMLDEGYLWNIVEYYDISEDQWDQSVLSGTPDRCFSAMVSTNDKVFIAGGEDWQWNGFTSVDIFYQELNTWFYDDLTEPRAYLGSIAYENKVFFAGGLVEPDTWSDRVDIYDLETNLWSIETLSVPRSGLACAATGGKVFFAGGVTGVNQTTNVVDVYDVSEDEWSELYLQESRGAISAARYGDKIYFAGGSKPDNLGSDIIEIYNTINEEWEEPLFMSEPKVVRAFNIYDALVFAGEADYWNFTYGIIGSANGKIEIYYPETGLWDTSLNLFPERVYYGCTSYKNKIFFGGGAIDDNYVGNVNILSYDTLWTEKPDHKVRTLDIRLYPNPFTTKIKIHCTQSGHSRINISLLNNMGLKVGEIESVVQKSDNHQIEFKTAHLAPGVYFCVIKTNGGMTTLKAIKME